MTILAFIIYNFIWLLITPFIPLYLLKRVLKNKGELAKIYNRFGFIKRKNSSKKLVYIHVASVGEVRSVFYLIDKLLLQNFAVHVTIMTNAGYEIVWNNFHKRDGFSVSFAPFDMLNVVLFFLNSIRPIKVIFVASEIWPNLLFASYILTKNNVYLVNAIMSANNVLRWNN